MRLKHERGTETFINDFGYYAIKQVSLLDGKDNEVILTPRQMRALIKDMRVALAIAESWADSEE